MKVKDCVEILDDKRIPLSSSQREKLEKKYRYYGAQGVIDYVDDYIFDGEYILVAEDGNNLKSLNENIATWATGKFWVNNHAHILGPKKGTNLKYVYYLINNLDLRGYITGSAQPKLNQENLANIELLLPVEEVQNKVANILSAIDKQIENNNKINSELESLAKTIYDYWFLQFEFPNEEGKPYKSSGGKMVWNDELKREIPEGWEVKKIKDCIDHINTGLNPRDNFTLNDGGDIKYITVKNLTTDGTLDFANCDLITKEVKAVINKRSMIAKGDILFASIAPLGRCFMMYETPEDWEINESVFSIRPNTNILNSEYLYMFFMSEWFIKKSEHASTGSIFSGIRISVLEDTLIIIPPQNVLEDFKVKVEPLYKVKFNNGKQSQELASLRDFLLPMLMNGQITFKDN